MFDRPLAATSATADNYADGNSLPNTNTDRFQFGAQCFSRAAGGVLYRLTDTAPYPGVVTPGSGPGQWVPEPHLDAKGHIHDDGTVADGLPLEIVGNLGLASVVRIGVGLYAVSLSDPAINLETSIINAFFKSHVAGQVGVCFGGRFSAPGPTIEIGRYNVFLNAFETGPWDFILYGNFV
jgi:hypothetical protein